MSYLEPPFLLLLFFNDYTVISLTYDIILQSRATAYVDFFIFSFIRCHNYVRFFAEQ